VTIHQLLTHTGGTGEISLDRNLISTAGVKTYKTRDGSWDAGPGVEPGEQVGVQQLWILLRD